MALDDTYVSRISSAHLFFIFSLSRRRTFSRMWDKSRVGDLSTLLDHSNIRDRTGGKLSVSTELQPVNGWHSICSHGFSGAVRDTIEDTTQDLVRVYIANKEALRGKCYNNGISFEISWNRLIRKYLHVFNLSLDCNLSFVFYLGSLVLKKIDIKKCTNIYV